MKDEVVCCSFDLRALTTHFCTLCFSFFLLVFRWEIVGRFSVPKAIVFVFDFEIIDGGQNGHGETIESGSNKTKAVCGKHGFP